MPIISVEIMKTSYSLYLKVFTFINLDNEMDKSMLIPFEGQPHKMIKHTQTILFEKLALKGLN